MRKNSNKRVRKSNNIDKNKIKLQIIEKLDALRKNKSRVEEKLSVSNLSESNISDECYNEPEQEGKSYNEHKDSEEKQTENIESISQLKNINYMFLSSLNSQGNISTHVGSKRKPTTLKKNPTKNAAKEEK